jgi:chitin synthase
MVKPPKNLKRNVISPAVLPEGANIDIDNTTGAAPWTEAAVKRQQTRRLQKGATKKGRGGGGDPEKPLPRSHSDAVSELDAALPVNPDGMISMASIGAELFCVCLVTCYSEGAEGIKITLDSIAGTTYSDARKLIFVVCDGMITGSGEKMSTPDICVGMIERDPRFGDPTPMSYVAVADGAKAHNQAMVYAGHYSEFSFSDVLPSKKSSLPLEQLEFLDIVLPSSSSSSVDLRVKPETRNPVTEESETLR